MSIKLEDLLSLNSATLNKVITLKSAYPNIKSISDVDSLIETIESISQKLGGMNAELNRANILKKKLQDIEIELAGKNALSQKQIVPQEKTMISVAKELLSKQYMTRTQLKTAFQKLGYPVTNRQMYFLVSDVGKKNILKKRKAPKSSSCRYAYMIK